MHNKRYINHIQAPINILLRPHPSKVHIVFENLRVEKQLGILEDNVITSLQDLNIPQSEGGYSFPPIPAIQGPFLSACATSPSKRVLDIGSGSGNDTIMALLSQNSQVIAVDIYQKQLDALKERVSNKCNGLKIGTFNTLKRNFADSNNSVPQKWVNGFNIINANKVFHFLSHEETITMVKNIHSLAAKDGLAFITVSTPNPGSAEEIGQFRKQKEASEPSIIFYDRSTKAITLGQQKTVIGFENKIEVSVLSNNKHNLPSPGYKKESLIQIGKNHYHVLSQARHFHDLETLTRYLNPLFSVVDSIIYNYDNADYFLSVIAKKNDV